jgi:hypothetical protein
MVLPVAALVAATIAAEGSRQIGGHFARKKAQKREDEKTEIRNKESRRETKSNALNQHLERKNDLEQTYSDKKAKNAKKKARGMQDVSDMVREALNI